jgi:8-oxo-dGTP pyrophosphatase MutT (NUDIX family)
MKTTCGIYLFNLHTRQFLLCHATRSRFDQWSIPKGLPDENESCYDAAIRELYEETGIKLEDLRVIQIKELPAVKYKKQNKLLQPFLLVTDTDLSSFEFSCISMVNDKYPEVDKYGWAGFDEMKTLAHESQRVNLPLIESEVKKF